MSFQSGNRKGKIWDDAILLDKQIHKKSFSTTSKKEKDFEREFAETLVTLKNAELFNSEVITQTHKESDAVESVNCFGKKHRPDMTLDKDGIAIELKYVDYAGLTQAIGQGYLYRIRYKFVFLILIISESKKGFYQNLCDGWEKDVTDTLQHLADEMNIFTYIVPSFKLPKPAMKKCHAFFQPINA